MEESTPFDWNSLLLNIYILGIILISSQFVIQLLSLYRIVKHGIVKKYNSFKLIEVSQDVSPFSFFNYIIYNPENFSEKELEIILNHEKAHGKQLHSIDILLSQLFLIFQWFNPVVWLYKKTIQQNLEFMADKEAIANIESKRSYQRTLVKVSVAPYCTSITNNFYNSLIKKRIVMLNQTSSKTRNLWKYSMILPALALFLMSFNTKTIEIVKENESAVREIPDSNNSQPISNSVIPLISEVETPITSEKLDNLVVEKDKVLSDVIVKITKDTTKEELDKIEKDLNSKGIEFSYSNLDYNAAGEITNIKLKYKDKEFGNSGSYHVNSDDNEPIKTIYIYTKDNGGFGIGNSPDGKAHEEHMRVHAEKMEEHKERIYEHKLKMKEHNKKIKEEHEVRMEEHRDRMENHKAEAKEEHEERVKEMKARHEERIEEHKERTREHKVRIKEHRDRVKSHDTIVYLDRDGKHKNTFAYATGYSSDKPGRIKLSGNKKALWIIDGKEATEGLTQTLDPDNIASVNVLKGKSAIALYGKKGKDGVIQVITKNKQSPWTVSYGISDVKFIPDEDDLNSSNFESNLFPIKKTTTDNELNIIKKKLASKNVDVSISKVKRNKNGEITRLKITIDNNKGSKSSTSYNTGKEGIPHIFFGQTNDGKIIISSKN